MTIFRRALFVILALGVAFFPVAELFGWTFAQAAILALVVPALLAWLAVFLRSEPLLARIGLVIIIVVYLFGVYVAMQESVRP